MAQCKGRYADKELTFTNGKVFYTERRCLGKATEEDLCNRCMTKQKIPFDPPHQIEQFQGKIGEEYYKRSVLYGSPWFLRKTQDEGFEVTQEDLRMAKQAQREAVMGTQMPRKKKEEVPVAQKDESKPEAKPKKPRAPRKKKEEVPPAPAPILPTTEPIAVESAEEPLEALEVIKIPVTLKTIHGKLVWYDSKKSKAYEVKKDKSVGAYLGRFDSAEDKIVEFPDSDVDV